MNMCWKYYCWYFSEKKYAKSFLLLFYRKLYFNHEIYRYSSVCFHDLYQLSNVFRVFAGSMITKTSFTSTTQRNPEETTSTTSIWPEHHFPNSLDKSFYVQKNDASSRYDINMKNIVCCFVLNTRIVRIGPVKFYQIFFTFNWRWSLIIATEL